ncbi:MAG: PAS domain S-box protein [Spirochaetales bacterium]|nr:PAS domain S-box protein [Spirochaetales bacterium]
MGNKYRTGVFVFFIGFLLFLNLSCRQGGELSEENTGITNEAVLLEPKRVLFISSYSPGLFTFDSQIKGIRRCFKYLPVRLDVDFMDTKNFPTKESLDNFKRSLKYKLENGEAYDAVIVGDDNGLVYLMDHKEELFPKTPLFFLGINDLKTALESQIDPMVTGVVEAKSVYKTLEMSYGLNPKARRVVCLIDNTVSSQAEFRDLMSFAPQFPDLEFISLNLSEGSLDEFLGKVAALDETDILHWLSAVRDESGRVLSYGEMRRYLVDVVNSPLYGLTSSGIGEGIMGGCVIRHEDQGYAAADMVMQYFTGTPVADIPFSTESPNAYMVDYEIFSRFGYSLDDLPPDTILVNRTYTFWELHGKKVLFGVFVFLLQGVIIFYLVINIRKRRENEEKFRSYIEYAPDGIFVVDEKGVILDVNISACRFSEFNREELIGQPIGFLFQRDVAEQAEAIMNGVSRDGYLGYEISYMTKSGRLKYGRIEAVKLSHNRYLGFAKDITDWKESEEEKVQLSNQLHQSQKMDAVGQLAGGVAHDFNNILGAIMGAAEILKSSPKDREEEKETYLDMIIKASKRAADLNKKLLAFSRKGSFTSSDVNMNEIIDDILVILNQTIDKNIEIITEWEAQAVMVTGDDSALQSSLLNLCINAVQAMTHGGSLSLVTRNVILDEDYCSRSSFDIEPGLYLDIEVNDTGRGIPDDVLDKIFEPFFTTKEEGTGLGLSAVFGTVQDHRGAVLVSSKESRGSLFHMILPCFEGEAYEEGRVEPVVPASGVVLLADKDDISRIIGKSTLEGMGYTVHSAATGLEAVELYQYNYEKIDLVILEGVMPRMNGEEVLKLMKETKSSCRVIISCPFGGEENRRVWEAKGAVGFVRKPLRRKELLKVLG